MVKITFDVSTRSNGWALMNGDKIDYGSFELKQFKSENLFENDLVIKNVCQEIHEKCKDEKELLLGLELSTFSINLSSPFSFVSGMIVSNIVKYFEKVEIKLFIANEWFRFYGDLNIKREERKEYISNLLKAKIDLPKEFKNDDESDALAMVLVLEDVTDSFIKKEEVKEREKAKTKTAILKQKAKLIYEKQKALIKQRIYELEKIALKRKLSDKQQKELEELKEKEK